MALRLTALFALAAAALTTQPALAECQKNAAGQLFATGTGNQGKAPDSMDQAIRPAFQRISAEEAAFLGALANLKACLGDGANSITGFVTTDVRYFDSDPVVEMDVAAVTGGDSTVTVIGTGLPQLKVASVSSARIGATKAAKNLAFTRAKSSLGKIFPEGKEGSARHVLEGSLSNCSTLEVKYWDDKAVTVKVQCGKGVTAAAEPKPVNAAPPEKHASK